MQMKITVLAMMVAGVFSVLYAQEVSVLLKHKSGKDTRFVQGVDNTLSVADRAAAEQARVQNGGSAHAGEVYFKKGVKTASNRYITTGRIAVRFSDAGRIDPAAFAGAHGLRYLGSVGEIAVFANTGTSDDLTQSNTLQQDAAVVYAAPDWVLPVKLY